MSTRPETRKVHRVLVMLDYGPDDPDSGEVIDVTSLISETVNEQNSYSAIDLKFTASYRSWQEPKLNVEIGWTSYCMNGTGSSGRSGWLADALNYSLPDNDRVDHLRKRGKAAQKKAEKLFADAKEAKMEQVAAVRHLHPIAKVTRASLEDLGK
jgi:hypothetical protein